VVHRAVKLVAENVAQAPLLLYEGDQPRDRHPLLALLAHPNPREEGAALIEAVTAHLLIAGNGYLEAVTVAGEVRELYALRPDRMRVVPGADGWAEAFGALEAAAVAADTHNAAAAWNKALLDNAARPSGALVYAGPDGAVLSDLQFERLKRELADTYQGATNAGRPLVLEGGLDWKPMSLTPRDMDFLEAKHAAAREIALAFGVPPMLLGIPGDNTYANYQEANRVLWRATVLPLAGRLGAALAQWLAPAFGENLRLAVDTDAIEALAADRAALWERVTAAPFLTLNEKRALVGFGPLDGGDRI
jgi:phage portal protein BeeE